MKKSLFILSLLFIGFRSMSQEFMGIKVDGSRQEVSAAFQAKGFTIGSFKQNMLSIKGSVSGTSMEVYCFFTPKSGKCWKFMVFMPEQSSWYSLKADYQKYYDILKEKYGNPDNSYSFFSSPYYEGDGYEMTAVAIEKCTYAAFWDNIISVQISKYKQVKLGYENPVNSKLDDEEKKSIDKKIF